MNKLAMMSLCAGMAVSGASGQVFQRHVDAFGLEKDFDVWQTRDGGYITTGSTTVDQGAPEDLLITKYDKDGIVTWQRAYRGSGRDIGYSVQETFEGDFVVAGETDSFGPGLGIIVMKLDPTGGTIWVTGLAGDIDADPLHRPFPGVALDLAQRDQGVDIREDIVIVGSYADPIFGTPGGAPPVLGGLPIVHRVNAGGVLVDSSVLIDPGLFDQQPERVHYNFTDVRVDPNTLDVVISGSRVVNDDPNPDNPFGGAFGDTDAMLFRLDPGLNPIWATAFDSPIDRYSTANPSVNEWGHGLTLDPNSGILLNGKTDFGAGSVGLSDSGSFLIEASPGGGLGQQARYDMFTPDQMQLPHAPGYAAVERGLDFQPIYAGTASVVQADGGPGGARAFMHQTDPGFAPQWSNLYGGQFTTMGESLAVNRECGYAMAGQFIDTATGSPVPPNQYLVKTDDAGDSGCLQREVFMGPEQAFEQFQSPVAAYQPTLFEQLPDLLTGTQYFEIELCYSQDCGQPTGPCNDADVAMPYGVLDLADVQTFLIGFAAMDPVADINNDGMWNLVDVQAFLIAFGAGCP